MTQYIVPLYHVQVVPETTTIEEMQATQDELYATVDPVFRLENFMPLPDDLNRLERYFVEEEE